MAQYGAYTAVTSLETTDVTLFLTSKGTMKITAENMAKALSVRDPITNHITFDESTGDIKVTTY